MSHGTTLNGDLLVNAGDDATVGLGDITLSSATGTLNVVGITTLNQTTIDTTNAQMSVVGTNKVSIAPTTSSGTVEILAGGASFFNTSAGSLTFNATNSTASFLANSDVTLASATGSAFVTSTSGLVNVTGNTDLDLNATTGTIFADAGAAISLAANAASNFTVTGGGILSLVSVTGRVVSQSGSSASNAIEITNTNASGGTTISSGTSGFTASSTGPFAISGTSAASSLSLATTSGSQNLNISLTGNTASAINITSSGTGAAAVHLTAGNTTGGITSTSGTGGYTSSSTGASSFTSTAFTSTATTGANTLTSTLGAVALNAGAATATAIDITATDTAGGITLASGTGGTNSSTTGTLVVTATGSGASSITTTGALTLESTKSGANALVLNANTGAGGLVANAGSNGVAINSQKQINLSALGSASYFTISTLADAQDLTLSVTGGTDSSVVIASDGTSNTDAISLSATAGGILANSTGTVAIQTSDVTNGVKIATTTAAVPVLIGTATSTVTIAGNLLVNGTTTEINTETLTVTDNVIEMNSGPGELGADSGVTSKRNQNPNNTGVGDVVSDTDPASFITGAFQAGSSTPATLKLAAGASAATDAYKGQWIVITSGAGINQVRRIKAYNGTTKVATIYITADNTTGPPPTPYFQDGLDLVTAPAAADTYSIYNSSYISSFYQSSTSAYVLAFNSVIPIGELEPGVSVFNIARYAPLNCGAIFIEDNGFPATSTLNVNYINETTLDQGVTIEGVLIKDGLVGGATPDTAEIVTLAGNTTPVTITNTSTTGSYMILVNRVTTSGGTVNQSGGAYATFMLSANGVNAASVVEVSSVKGSTGNYGIDIVYTAGQQAKLRHNGATIPSGTYYYKVVTKKVN